ncbi:MAG: helix-turn-helix domain-containing protein [Neomegalonema sp.]|nr:helix-turn-helix domain-containing protein [Neomegalonema sp.]
MPKLPDARRIKAHRVYSVVEAAEALGCHRQTVTRWIKSGALQADTSARPWLIRGCDLKAYAQERRCKNRQCLAPGELFCLSCRKPKRPAFEMADFIFDGPAHGRLVGLCPTCGGLMHRFARHDRIAQIAGDLDITMKGALPRLNGPD